MENLKPKARAQILGENLRRIRTDKKITRKDLADYLKIGVDTIGRYENGNILPPLDKIFELADIFKVSISSLTGENGYAQAVFNSEKVRFEYRLQKALELADEANYYPTRIKDGAFLLSIPAKVKSENDGVITFTEGSYSVKFESAEVFVSALEEVIRRAASGHITLDQAFRSLINAPEKK